MFAVLHISDFNLHAVLRATPGLVSAQPVAVLADDTTASARSRALLLAANLPARALGITAGLTASQALARCAALRLLSASPAAETEASATLLATAFTLSPLVEATAPGTATADVTGLAADERLPALRRAPEADWRRTPATTWHRLQRAATDASLALVVITPRPPVPSAQLRLILSTPHDLSALSPPRATLATALSPTLQRHRLSAASA